MIIYSEELRQEIRSLRKEGYTYPEICTTLDINIPKGSMSYICRGLVLEQKAIERLSKLAKLSIEAKRKQALVRNKTILRERIEKQRIKALEVLKGTDINTAKIALAFLYWGEGAKRRSYRGLSLGNSDPLVITTYMCLLEKCYSVPYRLLRGRVLCRADQNKDELEVYWSDTLGLPIEQFYPTYVDKRTEGRPTKRSSYKGVCVITGGSADIQLELDFIARNFINFIA